MAGAARGLIACSNRLSENRPQQRYLPVARKPLLLEETTNYKPAARHGEAPVRLLARVRYRGACDAANGPAMIYVLVKCSNQHAATERARCLSIGQQSA